MADGLGSRGAPRDRHHLIFALRRRLVHFLAGLLRATSANFLSFPWGPPTPSPPPTYSLPSPSLSAMKIRTRTYFFLPTKLHGEYAIMNIKFRESSIYSTASRNRLIMSYVVQYASWCQDEGERHNFLPSSGTRLHPKVVLIYLN